jgi:AcrR family transcriptional regulator
MKAHKNKLSLDRASGLFFQKARYQLAKKPLAQERPREIAALAARLFSEKGYTATAMSEIVAASGLSKGAIYHYFPQKDDILFAVLDSYMDVVIEGLEADLLSFSSVEDQIRYIIRRRCSACATGYTRGMTRKRM